MDGTPYIKVNPTGVLHVKQRIIFSLGVYNHRVP